MLRISKVPKAAIILPLILLLASCGSKEGRDALRAEWESVKSNAATAHMAAEAWTRGDLPKSYVVETIGTAGQDLATSLDTLKGIPDAASIKGEDGVTLADHVSKLRRLVQDAGRAVEQEDHASVAATVDALAKEEDAATKLAEQAGLEQ